MVYARTEKYFIPSHHTDFILKQMLIDSRQRWALVNILIYFTHIVFSNEDKEQEQSNIKKVSDDNEIPKSHTADQPMAQ